MDFAQLVQKIITSIFDPIVLLISGLALIYFLIGVFKYIQSTGDETKRKDGVTMMTYGIIGLFIMVSFWGLVHVLDNTFLFDKSAITPSSIRDTVGLPGGPSGPPSYLAPR